MAPSQYAQQSFSDFRLDHLFGMDGNVAYVKLSVQSSFSVVCAVAVVCLDIPRSLLVFGGVQPETRYGPETFLGIFLAKLRSLP
jgi:hypothetical protein